MLFEMQRKPWTPAAPQLQPAVGGAPGGSHLKCQHAFPQGRLLCGAGVVHGGSAMTTGREGGDVGRGAAGL